MLILNGGIPRSGTTWANQVIRLILDHKKIEYSVENLNNPDKIKAFFANYDPQKNVVIHYHDVIDPVVDYCRNANGTAIPFFNYRDPRDVVCSQIKMRNTSFENALKLTGIGYLYFNKATQIPFSMFIPYEHVIHSPKTIIYQIAIRLGLIPNFNMIEEIAEKTSYQNNQALIERIENDDPSLNITTQEMNGITLKGDADSMISNRHLQSGKTGRWKEELTPEQQQEVNEVFSEIITKLGFEGFEEAA